MTSNTKPARKPRAPKNPLVEAAISIERELTRYARQYVEQTGASQLVITDAARYDGPSIVARAQNGTPPVAIWLVCAGGTQLVAHDRKPELGRACRMVLDSWRGSRVEILRLDERDIMTLLTVSAASASREECERAGRRLDLIIQADALDHLAAEHAAKSEEFAAGARKHDDSDGYWSTGRDHHAQLAADLTEQARQCREESGFEV